MAVAQRTSSSSARLLASVRLVFPDEAPPPNEGIPEDLALLCAESSSVSFSLGSSRFHITKAAAVCEFPVRIRPVSWRYLQIFLMECNDYVTVLPSHGYGRPLNFHLAAPRASLPFGRHQRGGGVACSRSNSSLRRYPCAPRGVDEGSRKARQNVRVSRSRAID